MQSLQTQTPHHFLQNLQQNTTVSVTHNKDMLLPGLHMPSSQQKMSDKNRLRSLPADLVDFQFGHMAQNFLHLDLQGENPCISAEMSLKVICSIDSIDG